ncbi:MAG: hypothetical protein K8F92_10410 [Hyphomicrobium sp.]|uniref:hypothetical protein n=1 Tax=Hyphomicrobium sp. TaxID=82 RepID=UPI00132BA6F5|nr:hypothetical protein [Hyphomicrobium sp.]KAB2941779.1 MAG: hypothetical protein F9K20_08525 [Hyphomicrobium sp.]MBZ0210050.1 hypothetical protein [Hyphomicrobium sp.]MCZ7596447.1 hypothetical protein [Hyphomicrobium sp.]
MLPDDVFRSRLQTTITALRYWAPSIADAAHLEETETGDYWKIAVTPSVASACPFELILHADQRYDLAIADETYENRPIDSFDWFVPFAEAVAEGNVVQRHWISKLTGLERSVETLVTLPNGGIWREARGEPHLMPSIDDDGTELRERRFLPYRR